MPTIKLTKSSIDALEAGPKDVIYWDAALSGFGVKVTPAGRKVFVVLYRVLGGQSRLRKYTIGPYGRVTLQQARAAAQRVFAARLDGRDPASEKLAQRRRQVVDRIDDLLEAFIAEHVMTLRSGKGVARLLRRQVVPVWGARSVHEIKRRDISDFVMATAVQLTPHAAHKMLKALKRFFTWCLGRGLLESSPAIGIKSPRQERSRDRVLTDGELASILHGARQIPGPYGAIVELLALTGQRREEVARMTWDEVDFASKLWTLPSARSKNGKRHLIHLSEQALMLLNGMPRNGQFVFSITGAKPFNNFSEFKRRVDAICGVSNWCLHDLRRTCVSGMARLGIAPHVADKILNHQSGTITGVAAVYQRHEFLAERKEALDRWGMHVASLKDVRATLPLPKVA